MSIQCPACLAGTGPADRFCAHCGAPLQPATAHAQATIHGQELRLVTLVRCDIAGSTDLVALLTPEQGFLRLEPALAAMREAIRAAGGLICRELGDGVLGLFGAPRARDDHAVAACKAALDVQERIGALGDPGIQVRIGIHSSQVLAHVRQTDFAPVYDVGGTALHLSERIQAAAPPGGTLASAACVELASGPVRFEPVPAQRLKGFPDPLVLHRVAGMGDLSGLRARMARKASPFVGRQRQLAELLAAAAQASAGNGIALIVEGEPGIGKSRLVQQAAGRMAAGGWHLIRLEGSPLTRDAAFRILKSLLLALPAGPYGDLGLADAAVRPPRTRLTALQRAAIDSILERPIDCPDWFNADPVSRASIVANATLAAVGGALSAGRMILLIEDLQWVDDASAAALGALSGALQGRQLLLLATARRGEVPAGLAGGCRVLPLHPLEPAAGFEMLDTLLAGLPATDDFKARLLHHTGAVPLFIEEVCRQLAQADPQALLADVDRALDTAAVPATVQGVIAMRVDRLATQARDLLRVAAALGNPIDTTLLQQASGLSVAAVQGLLPALQDARLLVPADGGRLASAHELVRQVVYEAMPETQRVELHRRILELLMSHEPPDLPLQVHHALCSQQWQPAFDGARRLARTNLERSALAEAMRYADVALDTLDRLPMSLLREQQAVDLRIESRVAFSARGHVERWLVLAQEAERRAGAIADRRREVAAGAVRTAALNFYGSAADAVREGKTMLERARRLDDPGWCAYACYGLGQAHYIAGQCQEAVRHFGLGLQALDLPGCSAPAGNTLPTMRIMCHAMRALAWAALENHRAAAGDAALASAQAKLTQRPFDGVGAGLADGVCLLAAGEVTAARRRLEATIRLARERDVRLFLPITLAHLGAALMAEHRPAAALEVLREADTLAGQLGHASAQVRSAIHLAAALAATGAHAEAAESIAQAHDRARRLGFAGLEADARRIASEIEGGGAPGAATVTPAPISPEGRSQIA